MHVDSVELSSREKPFDPTAEFSLLTNLTYKTGMLQAFFLASFP
jgi:hypothetical protein